MEETIQQIIAMLNRALEFELAQDHAASAEAMLKASDMCVDEVGIACEGRRPLKHTLTHNDRRTDMMHEIHLVDMVVRQEPGRVRFTLPNDKDVDYDVFNAAHKALFYLLSFNQGRMDKVADFENKRIGRCFGTRKDLFTVSMSKATSPADPKVSICKLEVRKVFDHWRFMGSLLK
jgi:hypothetical protein